jgi:hypothetical protein
MRVGFVICNKSYPELVSQSAITSIHRSPRLLTLSWWATVPLECLSSCWLSCDCRRRRRRRRRGKRGAGVSVVEPTVDPRPHGTGRRPTALLPLHSVCLLKKVQHTLFVSFMVSGAQVVEPVCLVTLLRQYKGLFSCMVDLDVSVRLDRVIAKAFIVMRFDWQLVRIALYCILVGRQCTL